MRNGTSFSAILASHSLLNVALVQLLCVNLTQTFDLHWNVRDVPATNFAYEKILIRSRFWTFWEVNLRNLLREFQLLMKYADQMCIKCRSRKNIRYTKHFLIKLKLILMVVCLTILNFKLAQECWVIDKIFENKELIFIYIPPEIRSQSGKSSGLHRITFVSFVSAEK